MGFFSSDDKNAADRDLADRYDRGADDLIAGANRYSRDSEFTEKRLAVAQEYRDKAGELRR